MRRLAIATIGLLLAVPAQAGGIGLLMTGGVHGERVWSYSNATIPEGKEAPAVYDDVNDYEQLIETQTLPNTGAGLELILGDRDDRFLGTFRFYGLRDAAQRTPNDPRVKPENQISNVRDKARFTGLGMVGLTWGFLDLGDSVRFGVSTHVGSGFLTNDHLEYFAIDAGPTLSWRASRSVTLVGDVAWMMRHHKIGSQSINGFVTARYMFD